MSDAIWRELAEVGKTAKDVPLLDRFQGDPSRFSTFSARLGDMLLDFSKTSHRRARADAPDRARRRRAASPNGAT